MMREDEKPEGILQHVAATSGWKDLLDHYCRGWYHASIPTVRRQASRSSSGR